ncbi:MBL fold metallo-hydrolase [Schlesneria paludicola]|uniref:MBL fold metallo-hydrolase n=1 Tax=Schlesneria paludicola TaxID=360056 RepID=UPI000492DAAE|nr:MBL fold metallo-hydrolase [Schlesneria paludicola]
MPNSICTTCGTQYVDSDQVPNSCLICADERQYIGHSGQQWTTAEKLRQTNRTAIKFKEPGLIGIGIEPQFAIGQRALLLQTPHGNVLWDCISLLDESVVQAINAWGGIKAIVISHPHYYSNVVEWSRAFGDVPVYLHADDRQWVMRPDKSIVFWSGATLDLLPGVTLIHCGGHFAGGAVLHWAEGADGQGVLLSGDIIQVVADRKHVSFMYSYPNFVPLSASAVGYILSAVRPYSYRRIYGAFWGAVVQDDGMAVVNQSAQRYLTAIRE